MAARLLTDANAEAAPGAPSFLLSNAIAIVTLRLCPAAQEIRILNPESQCAASQSWAV